MALTKQDLFDSGFIETEYGNFSVFSFPTLDKNKKPIQIIYQKELNKYIYHPGNTCSTKDDIEITLIQHINDILYNQWLETVK